MPRALFEKLDNARFISHLDLLVVLLLLLMAGEEDSGNALLTLALYLFL